MSIISALVLAAGILLVVAAVGYLLGRIARRHQLPILSNREAVDNLRPYGADISIAPSRAPRNGTVHDPTE